MKFSALSLTAALALAPAIAAPVAAQTAAAPAANAPAPAPAALTVPTAPDSLEVVLSETVWRDDARKRDVPVKVFCPKAAGPFPLVILSHGLGGSRDSLDYLGRYWAAHGYVCAQVQHLGTDESVWKGAPDEAAAAAALSGAARDVNNILNRPRDVSFAIDQMLAASADAKSPLAGKINADQIGVAGHSLGALTALLSAGEDLLGPDQPLDLADPRIKACVAMSSPVIPQVPVAQQFAGFETPTFYLVGSTDREVLGATIAQRQIYDAIDAPNQLLLILKGADHMTFGGGRFGPDLPADARDHALTQAATLAFLESQLKAKPAAQVWLRDDFRPQLAAGDVFETK